MVWDFLEDSGAEVPHTGEIQAMQRIVQKMSKVFESHGLPMPDDFSQALVMLANTQDAHIAHALDNEFAALLVSEGYMSLIDLERFPEIRSALTLDRHVEARMADGSLTTSDRQAMLRMHKSYQETLPAQTQRREEEVSMWQQLFAKTQFHTFKLLLEVAETMRDRQVQISNAVNRSVLLLESHANQTS
jgi:hypothetical protein